MTLRRRFLLQNLLLAGFLLTMGLVSMWRLGMLSRDLSPSRNVYAEMRTVGDVAINVGMVRGLLSDPKGNREQIVTHLGYAIGGLDQFIQVGKGYDAPGGDQVMRAAYVPINRAADSARRRLAEAMEPFQTRPTPPDDGEPLQATVDESMEDLGRVANSCLTFMSDRQQAASDRATGNFILIGGMSLAAVAAAVGLSVVQDRRVMQPLQHLRQGVRRVAAAQFMDRLPAHDMAASPEFLDLAHEFNRMAEELDGFYRRLEEQVRAKSRELIRSERLASVGFLAAGVAHEINNPLNIISGYAELTARQLAPGRPPLQGAAAAEAHESLQLIRSEAFRCKEITEKLLSLARGGSDGRQAMNLTAIVNDVAAMIKGLRNYRDRRVVVRLDPAEPLEIEANPTEMKQVLLNLTINALEAAPAERGEVCIEGHRTPGWVELQVRDNGRGMEPEVLRHVFEPFFSHRNGDDAVDGSPRERGTGLGLSITHAIIESHGGRIQAQSEGSGRGSCFTVRLPTRHAAGRN